MTYDTKRIKYDLDGRPIPQLFDGNVDDYVPAGGAYGAMLVNTMQRKWRHDFPGAALDATVWNRVQTGSGHTVAVTSSELSIATGTTINTETIIQSVNTFSIPFRVWFILKLSQRIANQEFYLEIINQAGDCYAQWLLDGTSATIGKINACNNGTAGTAGSQTIVTTASYAIAELEAFPDEIYFHSRAVDSTAIRSNSYVRTRLIPDPEQGYYIRIRAKNLGTAPASSTTLTIDAILVQDITELTTEITAGRGPAAPSQAMAVQLVGGNLTGNQSIGGAAAHDAAISGNPLRIAGRALTANYTAVSTGDVADLITTLVGALIQKPYAIPEQDWQYGSSTAVTNTTDVTLKAAGTAGIRNYVTAIQFVNTGATATVVVIKDGSTVIWAGNAQQNVPITINFPTPLKGTAATALNFACLTTAANVYVAVQGYQAP